MSGPAMPDPEGTPEDPQPAVPDQEPGDGGQEQQGDVTPDPQTDDDGNENEAPEGH